MAKRKMNEMDQSAKPIEEEKAEMKNKIMKLNEEKTELMSKLMAKTEECCELKLKMKEMETKNEKLEETVKGFKEKVAI
jgi:peptidoglycan hydrolase CwlO-like protein